MRWLVDAQLPHRLASHLIKLGDEAVHTRDLPLANATPDAQVIEQAQTISAVVMTKDADFVNHFQLYGKPRLLLISTGNISNNELINLVTKQHAQLTQAFVLFDFVELSRGQLICHS